MKVWLPLLIYLSVQCITPGPNNLTCLYLGATNGLRGTKFYLLGSMSALVIKAFLCGGLNLALANNIPVIASYLKWFGAGYMVYLAIKMILSGWKDRADAENENSFTGSSFGSGVMLQILNGKSWVVAFSIFAVYVIPISSKWTAIAGATFVFVLFALGGSLIWAVFGVGLKRIVSRYRKAFGILAGCSLILCAVSAIK